LPAERDDSALAEEALELERLERELRQPVRQLPFLLQG
jgi:hypothetical protein